MLYHRGVQYVIVRLFGDAILPTNKPRNRVLIPLVSLLRSTVGSHKFTYWAFQPFLKLIF